MSSANRPEVLKELVDHAREAWDIKPIVIAGNAIDYVVRGRAAPVLQISPPADVQDEATLLSASMDLNAHRVRLLDGLAVRCPRRVVVVAHVLPRERTNLEVRAPLEPRGQFYGCGVKVDAEIHGPIVAAPEPGQERPNLAARCSPYVPEIGKRPSKGPLTCGYLVGDTGFEPVTSSVSRKRATAAPIARGKALSCVVRGGYGI